MESSSVRNHSSARESDLFNHEYDRTGRHKVLLTPPGDVLSFFSAAFSLLWQHKQDSYRRKWNQKTKVPDVRQTSNISQRIIAEIFMRSSTKYLTLRKSCAIFQVEGQKTLFQERKKWKKWLNFISQHRLTRGWLKQNFSRFHNYILLTSPSSVPRIPS